MNLVAVSVDGSVVPRASWQFVPGPWGERGLVRIPLARPLEPGQRMALVARFTVKVPRRYGLFGVVKPTLGPGPVMTLAGGFFPFVPELGEAGFDLAAPPPVARFELDLEVPGDSDLLVNGRPYRAPSSLRGVRSRPGGRCLSPSRTPGRWWCCTRGSTSSGGW